MWKGMWNICDKAGKLPCENKCENTNYVKYHVKWDVKSYSHDKRGNHPKNGYENNNTDYKVQFLGNNVIWEVHGVRSSESQNNNL